VRTGEDAGHLGVGVDAVLLLERDVRELVAGGGAGVDPGDGLAPQLFELGNAAVTAHVELRAVGGAALAYGGHNDLGAVGIHRLHESGGPEHADVDPAGTHGFDEADVVGAYERLDGDEEPL